MKVERSYTARPTRGRGIEYGFVSTVDTEDGRQEIRDVRHGSQSLLSSMSMIHRTLYALLEDVQIVGPVYAQRVRNGLAGVDLLKRGLGMDLQETKRMVEEEAYASQEA
ncbi:hypothetical protein Tco_0873038 [Tanacetum coccineum]